MNASYTVATAINNHQPVGGIDPSIVGFDVTMPTTGYRYYTSTGYYGIFVDY